MERRCPIVRDVEELGGDADPPCSALSTSKRPGSCAWRRLRTVRSLAGHPLARRARRGCDRPASAPRRRRSEVCFSAGSATDGALRRAPPRRTRARDGDRFRRRRDRRPRAGRAQSEPWARSARARHPWRRRLARRLGHLRPRPCRDRRRARRRRRRREKDSGAGCRPARRSARSRCGARYRRTLTTGRSFWRSSARAFGVRPEGRPAPFADSKPRCCWRTTPARPLLSRRISPRFARVDARCVQALAHRHRHDRPRRGRQRYRLDDVPPGRHRRRAGREQNESDPSIAYDWATRGVRVEGRNHDVAVAIFATDEPRHGFLSRFGQIEGSLRADLDSEDPTSRRRPGASSVNGWATLLTFGSSIRGSRPSRSRTSPSSSRPSPRAARALRRLAAAFGAVPRRRTRAGGAAEDRRAYQNVRQHRD